jgi:hypothetical protein
MTRDPPAAHDHSKTGTGGRRLDPDKMILRVVDEISEVNKPEEGELIFATGNGTPAKGLHRYDGSSWTKGAATANGGITAGLNNNFQVKEKTGSFSGTVTVSGAVQNAGYESAVIDGFEATIEQAGADVQFNEIRGYYDGNLQFTFTETLDMSTSPPYDRDLASAELVDQIEIDVELQFEGTGNYDAIVTPKTVPQTAHSH